MISQIKHYSFSYLIAYHMPFFNAFIVTFGSAIKSSKYCFKMKQIFSKKCKFLAKIYRFLFFFSD